LVWTRAEISNRLHRVTSTNRIRHDRWEGDLTSHEFSFLDNRHPWSATQAAQEHEQSCPRWRHSVWWKIGNIHTQT
jgi:hypothetical protein